MSCLGILGKHQDGNGDIGKVLITVQEYLISTFKKMTCPQTHTFTVRKFHAHTHTIDEFLKQLSEF